MCMSTYILRGGPASGEIIRRGHQLEGKRAAQPKTCPRTDVDDNDCRQYAATNEHEIMNKLGHATKPSTLGLLVRYEIINNCGETNVGEARNTHAGDRIALCLRFGGRGGQPVRAGFGRSYHRRGPGRGRQGGGQASVSEAKPEPLEFAHNTVAGNDWHALEDHAQAANTEISPHDAPTNCPLPSTLPELNPKGGTVPHRNSNPSFDPAPPAQQNLGAFPLQPAQPDSNLSIGCPSPRPSGPSSDTSSGSVESPIYMDRKTHVNRKTNVNRLN